MSKTRNIVLLLTVFALIGGLPASLAAAGAEVHLSNAGAVAAATAVLSGRGQGGGS